MGLGNLFKAVIQTGVGLPVSIIKDVFTALPRLADDERLFTSEKIDEIADELNKITK